MGSFIKGECSRKGVWRIFCSKMFYNGYENLIELPNYVSEHAVWEEEIHGRAVEAGTLFTKLHFWVNYEWAQ